MNSFNSKKERMLGYPFGFEKNGFTLVNGKGVDLLNFNISNISNSKVEGGSIAALTGLKQLDLSDFEVVFSYGSNCSKKQLELKYRDNKDALVINLPFVLSNYQLAYSAHLSPYRSCPYTIYKKKGAQTYGFLSFIKKENKEDMDKSESIGVNYKYEKLDTSIFVDTVKLESVGVYISLHGPLRVKNDTVDINQDFGEGPSVTQEAIQKLLHKELNPLISFDQHIQDLLSSDDYHKVFNGLISLKMTS